MIVEKKIEQMGYILSDYLPEEGNATNHVEGIETSTFVFTSGQSSISKKGGYTGRLGESCTVEQGQKGAIIAVLKGLGVLSSVLGDLDYIAQVVKIVGYVNSTVDFAEQEKVMDGASEFLATVFGTSGIHSRTVVGVSNLPDNACCCIDITVEVKE